MIQVIKQSGEIEPLREEKIKSCVARVGGSYELGEKITKEITKKLPPKITSEELYKRVFERLKKENPLFSIKLNLKKAIFDLGPSGFPFEKYFSELLKFFGYKTEINLFLEGKCVKHEIDILATKSRTRADYTQTDVDGALINAGMSQMVEDKFLIECKFHQRWGTKCEVQTPLYVFSRVLDINDKNNTNYTPWLATNTRLTFDAIDYSECQNIKITSWRYPFCESLEQMIEKSKKYPITILISGNFQIYQKLISQNIVLAEDLLKYEKNYIQRVINLSGRITENLFNEAKMLV